MKGGIIMAIKQIGITVGGNIKRYIADEGDVLPTTDDCGPGSTVLITNPNTHILTLVKIFDGTNWNEV